MCYTGLCPYEVSSGPNAGECTITDGAYPDDADCAVVERMQEAEEPEDPC